jgi:hypothetical protein
MSTDHRAAEPDYEAVRRYVEANLEQAKRRQRRRLWRLHFLLYVSINSVIWGSVLVDLLTDPWWGYRVSDAAIVLTIGWTVGLFLHARMLYLESPAGVRRTQGRLAMEALQNQAARESPKLKREQIMRLSDDGELVSDEPLDVEVKYHAQSES